MLDNNNVTTCDYETFWVDRINFLNQTITRYISSIILFVGNVGLVFTCLIFWQPTFRQSACTTYFIAAGLSQVFTFNFALLTRILQFGYNINTATTYLWFCKLRFYLFYISISIPRYNLILASIDRYFASSRNAFYRQWSSPRIVIRLIIGNIVFWCLIYIQVLIFYEIDGNQCLPQSGSYRTFFSIYIMIDSGILPFCLMLIFGLLTIRNVRRSRRLIAPSIRINSNRISRKDNQLYRMLASQIFLFVILNLLNPCYLIYQSFTMYTDKSTLRTSAESFVSNMTYILIYLSFGLTFPTFLISSEMFRQEFIQVIQRRVFRRDL